MPLNPWKLMGAKEPERTSLVNVGELMTCAEAQARLKAMWKAQREAAAANRAKKKGKK